MHQFLEHGRKEIHNQTACCKLCMGLEWWKHVTYPDTLHRENKKSLDGVAWGVAELGLTKGQRRGQMSNLLKWRLKSCQILLVSKGFQKGIVWPTYISFQCYNKECQIDIRTVSFTYTVINKINEHVNSVIEVIRVFKRNQQQRCL